MSLNRRAFGLAALGAALASGARAQTGKPDLLIFAAASLHTAFKAIAEAWHNETG